MNVFPGYKNSKSYASGYHDLKSVLAEVSNVNVSATIRHYVSTRFAEQETGEKAKELLRRHLGHAPKINDEIYKAPMAVKTLAVIGQFFDDVGRGKGMTCVCGEYFKGKNKLLKLEDDFR